MLTQILAFFVFLSLYQVFCIPRERHEDLYKEKPLLQAQEQKWFESQRLDHFNPLDNRTWRQRYWVLKDYYDPKKGPVFLFICGEYTCGGVPSTRTFIIEVAKSHKAMILTLEHRFYGASQPFGDANLSVANLQYLSADQGLEDLAYFIRFTKTNKDLQISEHQKWITVGGSYPGAMSAWFRYKYPHLTVGALASSAVINAIEDYWQYDDQVWNSLSKSNVACASDAQQLTKTAEVELQIHEKEFKKAWNCDKLTNEQFLNLFNDIFDGFVQHGQRTYLCKNLSQHDTIKDKLEMLRLWSLDNFNQDDYTIEGLQNETYDINKAGRQWNWQVCTQFGWLFTSSKNAGHEIVSKNLTIDWWNKEWCQKIFGNFVKPQPNAVNIRLGALDTQVTNIVFTNGGEDGWRWASLNKDKNHAISLVADCDDCSHCVDLSTPNANDAFILKYVRFRIQGEFIKWLYL